MYRKGRKVEQDLMKPWFRKTFIDVFDEAAERYANRIAIIFQDYEMTYRELGERVNRLAKGLVSLGVGKGDHVSIWLPNSIEWIICKFAIIKAGAVMIPVNTRYKSKEVEYILRQSDTTTLFMTDRFLHTDFLSILREILPDLGQAEIGKLKSARLPVLRNIILNSDRAIAGCVKYVDVMEMGRRSSEEDLLESMKKSVLPSDIVNIQYTSGTTGEPKGAMLTHRMLLGAFGIMQILNLTERDRLILPLPFFHCFANLNGLLPFMMSGGSIVLMDIFHPEEELRLIEKHRCTVIYGVPTMYIMMLSSPKFDSFDLSSLRTGNLGGSPPPIKLVKDILFKMGVRELTANYGMTENSCSVCATRIGDPPEVIAATVGRPFPLVEAKVVDIRTRKEQAPGHEGLVYIRGPYVMEGYYKKSKETREAIDEEGWLNTGDLGKLDEKGNFTLTGRHKDLIMPGGENVSPAEVENFIFEHPSVRDVQVVGVPDERLGEVVMAFIILKQGAICTEEDFILFCKSRMASFKVPKYVRFVEEFPLTPTGKIQKFKLREEAIKTLGLK
jgi:fatty-acyl-CoA synthase